MSVREVIVTLERADGETLDITHRVAKGGLGTLSADIEMDLGDLAHDDITLSLDDQDEGVKSFLFPFTASELVQLIVERETLRRRPKWERAFGGVLNLPWSYRRNRKSKLIELRAFSYTKVAENASAESVVREFSTIGTGTVTIGTDVVTLGSTTGIVSGDVLSLSDEATGETEEQTVDRISSGTQLITVSVWAAAFTAATAEITTPFHRWTTPASLASLLVAELDLLEAGNLDFDNDLAAVPIITPMSQNGLPSGLPASPAGGGLVEVADGVLEVCMSRTGSAAEQGRYQGTPQGLFTRTSSSNDVRGDWSPYLHARPASFPSVAGVGQDTGLVAWDHQNNREYRLTGSLGLMQNGVTVHTVDTFAASYTRLEYDAVANQVWVAYLRSNATKDTVQIYNVATDTSAEFMDLPAGQLRYVRALGLPAGGGFITEGVMVWLSRASDEIRVYEHNPLAFPELPIRTKQITGDAVPAGLMLWTLRYMDGVLWACYIERGRVRVRVWDTNWEVLADFDFAPAKGSAASTYPYNPATCVYDDPTFGKVGIISNNGGNSGSAPTGNVFGVLSKKYAGVIPYADLDGMSVAGALKDLAIASLSVFRTDHYGLASILSRNPDLEYPVEIDDLVLEDQEVPLWENYREFVKVSGVGLDGAEVSETAGTAQGSPSREFEVSSKFVNTAAHAKALATAYASLFSVEREQRDITIVEPEEPLEPLSVVLFEDRKFVVIPRVASDFDAGQQELTIVEALGQ